jgi:uncharacterized protein
MYKTKKMARKTVGGKSIFLHVALFITCLFMLASSCMKPAKRAEKETYAKYLEPVSYMDVTINDNFWAPRIKLNQKNGIRSVFESGKTSLVNFDIASGRLKGEHDKKLAADSDIYKIIQGVAYSLHHAPDKELEAFTDSLIDMIVAAQEDDGYLFTYWTVLDPERKWTNIKKDHELYCAGHLFEAAVAYYEVTGKRKLLDAAIKLADHIDSIFGPGKRIEVPGHQEIELALYKLYKTTSNERYLRLAEFFINERGNPERVDTVPPDNDPLAGTPNRWRHPSYRQDHLPVEKQFHATGHGVRAVYMYSAMADLAHETRSDRYLPALDSLWNDIITKKLYVTAGIGTHEFHDEGFGTPYKLPNHSAYCESCSGMGFSFWNRRMNLLHGDAAYADLVELLIYNAAISSVSLSGDKFFYRNPLESEGKSIRRPWFNPACCPSNMVRFLPEIGATIYAKDDNGIYINQFIGNEANIRIGDKNVNLRMETSFPWEGNVDVYVDPTENEAFKLYVRIPAWTTGKFLSNSDIYTFTDNASNSSPGTVIKVNGKRIRKPDITGGYAVIDREWKKGDHLEVEFPMVPHGLAGHPEIEATRGKVALMRGPVVYCLEEIDNPDYFKEAEEPKVGIDELSAEFDENLLGGVVRIKTKATTSANTVLEVTYVPYYSWANREVGKMKVWAALQ